MPESLPNTDYIAPLSDLGFRSLGRMHVRHARDIEASPWSIGCETIDRAMVEFAHTGPHLGELGAKAARVQAGWARCEPVPGADYDWRWLDEIVEGCVSQGVAPWLETSYGNPVYEGGGGVGLAEGIPTSAEALAAWDRWVEAMCKRYGDRVDTWEIWNEPDIHHAMTPVEYAVFFVRTVQIIRRIQPHASIIGLALAGRLDFAETFLKYLQDNDKTELLDHVTFHFYPHNPDDQFITVDKLRNMLAECAPHVTLRQGETGAPAETQKFMAMGNFDWSPRKQAAWDLRRLLAHHGRGIAMSLFQLSDMYYSKQKGIFEGRNPKGMLCINPDKTVSHRRPAYFMAQHVFSLLDCRFPLKPLALLTAHSERRIEAYAWTLEGEMKPSLVAWWDASEPPALETPALSSVGIAADMPSDAVLLDFISGTVFELPDDFSTDQLPCSDTPFALVERQLVLNTQ